MENVIIHPTKSSVENVRTSSANVAGRLVTWDEFSMLGVDHFDMTDLRLRQAKNEPDLEFGGVGISLSPEIFFS